MFDNCFRTVIDSGDDLRRRRRCRQGSPGCVCRCACLFGDPRLALTTPDRLLDITADAVRAIAARRLRRENRAVIAYEPVAYG